MICFSPQTVILLSAFKWSPLCKNSSHWINSPPNSVRFSFCLSTEFKVGNSVNWCLLQFSVNWCDKPKRHVSDGHRLLHLYLNTGLLPELTGYGLGGTNLSPPLEGRTSLTSSHRCTSVITTRTNYKQVKCNNWLETVALFFSADSLSLRQLWTV